MKREVVLQQIIDIPQQIKTYDFTAPTIDQRYLTFRLTGLGLPHNWFDAPFLHQQKENQGYTTFLNSRLNISTGYKLTIDKGTGLATELELSHGKNTSRVILLQDNIASGRYIGEDMGTTDAVFYLEFIARLLSCLAEKQIDYPYIFMKGYGKCGSAELAIPQKFRDPKEPVTNPFFQERFEHEVCNIAGRFSVTTRPLVYKENGLLGAITLEEAAAKDCNYRLDNWSGRYVPHNVDCFWEAAALHGIAAAFINSLLKMDRY